MPVQAFSLTKLIVFHESASVMFLALGFAALAVLWSVDRPLAGQRRVTV